LEIALVSPPVPRAIVLSGWTSATPVPDGHTSVEGYRRGQRKIGDSTIVCCGFFFNDLDFEAEYVKVVRCHLLQTFVLDFVSHPGKFLK
jgi:hypothetical protein